jgi:transcriptional regulator with XRE-family HTH domain
MSTRKMSVSNNPPSVGLRVRELRLKSGISIKDFADRSGISVNTLSLLERGKTSPTVSTLQCLAAALSVPIVAFFENEPNAKRVVFTQSGMTGMSELGYGSIRTLGTGFMDATVEPLQVQLNPGAASGDQNISHAGYEFVFCLKGEVAYFIENEQYRLKRGDNLLFDSILPHQWRNSGQSTAEFLLIFFPAASAHRAAGHHFPVVPVRPRGKR